MLKFILTTEFGVILYSMISIIAFAIIQIKLCKAQNTLISFIPTTIQLIAWIFVLLTYFEVFGKFDSYYIDGKGMAVSILLLLFLPSTIGIAVGWIYYFIRKTVKIKKS